MRGHRTAPYRRTYLAATVVSLVVAAQLLAPRVSAAGQDSGFVAGSAGSTAQAIQFAPSTGGLGYKITLAESVADYQGNEGQAEAQGVDLGVIGTTLETQGCDGSPPVLSPGAAPQPAVAESTNGNASSARDLQGGGGVTMGHETATATTQPAATATTTLTGFSVPGAVDIGAGTSSAGAQLVRDTARQADATADIGRLSLLGGKVVLTHLHWDTTQRTGQGPTQDARFTVGGITVAGVQLPVAADTLAQAFGVVNQALAPSGFHITPPATVKGADGSVQETPLSVGIDNSALGRQLLGPALGAAQPLRTAIADALLKASCQFATPLLVSDIAIGPLAGGGTFDINLGGVTATSDGTAYANPFGAGGLGANPLSAATGAGGDGLGGSDVGGSGGPLGSVGVTAAPGAAAGPQSRGLLAATRAVACRTTHPFGHPACSNGAALPVGLAGLALVTGLGVADLTRVRRRRITTGGETA